MKTKVSFFSSQSMDVGRVLAATAIFYFHAGLLAHYPFSRYGEFAVEYFVMLSGVSYALFSSRKPSTCSEYFAYIKRRLTTLFPLYLLVNLALFMGSFYFPSKLGKPFTFAEFLASVSGTSMFFGWPFMSAVMWFMPFILQVYLLIPLIDWCADRWSPMTLMITSLCISLLLAQGTQFFVGDGLQAKLVCKNWSPIFRLPEVCVGVILGRLALKRGGWKTILAVAMFGAFSLSVYFLRLSHWHLRIYLPWEGFMVPVLLFAAAGLISPLTSMIDSKHLRLLGIASFFFYLIQGAPMRIISHRFGEKLSVWGGILCALLGAGSGQHANDGPFHQAI